MDLKAFSVTCAHCNRPFHVRFEPGNPGDDGEGNVVVSCQYCGKEVVIAIPKSYIPDASVLKSSKRTPGEG